MDTLDTLLQHDAWATRATLSACARLSEEQLHRRFEIGPGSLHDTLLHVLGAMSRWADRIGGRALRPSLDAKDARRTPAQMIELLEASARDLAAVAGELRRQGRLDEVMELTLRGYPTPFRFSRRTALVHVCTHGAHHRAQALNMLRHLGVEELPEVDAITWGLVDTA